jgi:acyl-CoA reductase-like NAD-dependent aldehyde dehydrogenase
MLAIDSATNPVWNPDTVNTHTHYINGKWTPSADESTFDVRNPYDDSLYARAAAGTAAEADQAVTAADSAFPAWADLGAERKQELFLRAAEIVERQHDDLSPILAAETGASHRFRQFQQDIVIRILRQAADWVFKNPGAPPDLAGVATGAFNASRQVGAAIGVALFGALLSGRQAFISEARLTFALAAAAALLAIPVTRALRLEPEAVPK